mmetsp:Transcript_82744/g.267960  ORF Transcript_82744/g.267960 Transcript_82744/m.267960 type:complete len:225 (-) Transcript_82744:465-1139(-)
MDGHAGKRTRKRSSALAQARILGAAKVPRDDRFQSPAGVASAHLVRQGPRRDVVVRRRPPAAERMADAAGGARRHGAERGRPMGGAPRASRAEPRLRKGRGPLRAPHAGDGAGRRALRPGCRCANVAGGLLRWQHCLGRAAERGRLRLGHRVPPAPPWRCLCCRWDAGADRRRCSRRDALELDDGGGVDAVERLLDGALGGRCAGGGADPPGGRSGLPIACACG